MTGLLSLTLQLASAAATVDASVRSARTAQERFEITRRAHLPQMRSYGSRPCDIIVGRFCFWYDSTETKPIPEPQRIVAARRNLVTLLDSLAARHPENDWIAGQRVRYTIEEGDSLAPLRASRECRGTTWWCAALEGLSHHVSGRYADADSAFQRALAVMPEEQRCDWMDLRRQVAHTMTPALNKASCAERAAMAQRLWQSSQPLWSVAGNDLRTEHFARHTMALILARSANPHGLAWSGDTRELLLRYGWSEWFTRAEPSPYQVRPGNITGHDREPSYFMFPTTSSPYAPIAQTSWELRDASMPMRYAPRHIEWLGDLAHQLVRLPSADSMRLIAVARVRDSALARDSVGFFLGIRQRALHELRVAHGRALSLVVPNDSAVVSIEALGAGTKRAERARYSIGPLPCERRCLSDLLLFEPPDADSVVSLDDALRRALTGHRVAAAQPLGVYWEVGDGPDARTLRDSLVWASVSVEPERMSTMRRVAAGLRLARAPAAVRLRWRMRLSQAGHVTLRLPPSARGRYRVKLSIDGVGSSERAVVFD